MAIFTGIKLRCRGSMPKSNPNLFRQWRVWGSGHPSRGLKTTTRPLPLQRAWKGTQVSSCSDEPPPPTCDGHAVPPHLTAETAGVPGKGRACPPHLPAGSSRWPPLETQLGTQLPPRARELNSDVLVNMIVCGHTHFRMWACASCT